MGHDLALVNARLRDPVAGVAEDADALLVVGGRIADMGRSDDLVAEASRRHVEVIDVAGKVLLPGFVDTHLHMMATGLAEAATDLYACRSVAEVLDLLQACARDRTPGEWVHANRLDEALLADGRPPTRQELDRVCGGVPVYLEDRGLHYVVLSTAGMERLALAGSAGLVMGQDGTPNGRLQEAASGLARRRFSGALPRAQRLDALRRAAERFAREGLTTVHGIEGGELFDDDDATLLRELAPDLPVNVLLYWSTDDVAAVKAAGLPRMGGDICADGSIGSRTAAFADPYDDDPTTRGQLTRDAAVLEALVRAADDAGIQLGVHAIGELGIDVMLTALERSGADITAARHRIDHFGVPREADIERAAQLGAVIPTQPAFPFLRGGPGSVYERRLGAPRDQRAYPLRRLLDAGLVVAGGSDSPVVPSAPLLGIHGCVNHPHPEQRLTVAEALRLYTVNGAYVGFGERDRGRLLAGMVADLVVLDRDPVEVRPEELRDLQVQLTISGGALVYSTPTTKEAVP